MRNILIQAIGITADTPSVPLMLRHLLHHAPCRSISDCRRTWTVLTYWHTTESYLFRKQNDPVSKSSRRNAIQPLQSPVTDIHDSNGIQRTAESRSHEHNTARRHMKSTFFQNHR